jgi:hypothetical protein
MAKPLAGRPGAGLAPPVLPLLFLSRRPGCLVILEAGRRDTHGGRRGWRERWARRPLLLGHGHDGGGAARAGTLEPALARPPAARRPAMRTVAFSCGLKWVRVGTSSPLARIAREHGPRAMGSRTAALLRPETS